VCKVWGDKERRNQSKNLGPFLSAPFNALFSFSLIFYIFLLLHFSIPTQSCLKSSHQCPPTNPFLPIALPAVDLLRPLVSDGIIAPLRATRCLQGPSSAFVYEPCCYQQAFRCSLPFPLSNLIAEEK